MLGCLETIGNIAFYDDEKLGGEFFRLEDYLKKDEKKIEEFWKTAPPVGQLSQVQLLAITSLQKDMQILACEMAAIMAELYRRHNIKF